MIFFLFFLIGAGMAIAPWCVSTWTDNNQAKILLSVIGALVILVVGILTMITRLYRKASANMAFVRTGMGGAQVIKDAGTLVLPVVHQIIPVSLETMRLKVERSGEHALITKDNLRVDLSAEFYIKVQANADDILQAARSLGGRNVQPEAVSELVQEKLVSALRTVAATKDLVELHAKRDEFASAVQAIVTHDLASNGLTLESVTISSLDQTDPTQLQERNVFDAQGLRKIAEITQKARVERNEIEREAERAVVMKNVDTRKKMLDLERDQAEFEAEQKMKVANVRAGREREVAEFKISQDEAVAKRDIEKMRSIETAEVERTLVVEQAQIAKQIALVVKQKEQETSQILKKQAVDVAERAKEVAIAQKEQERAAAQAAMLAAEAQKEQAKQSVMTVQVTAEAAREAEKKLIAAKQVIQENRIRQETTADVSAYAAVKQAEGERKAADMQYEAKLRLAEGDAQANIRRADGEKAIKMVDVTVEREKVNVEQARVDVERQSLSNKQEFEQAALKFELEKLRIQAEKEVRVQAAVSMGNMLAKANVQVFGDPDTMAKMSERFMRAASWGTAAEGLMTHLSPEVKALLEKLGVNLTSQFTDQPKVLDGDGRGKEAVVAAAAPKAEIPEPSKIAEGKKRT